MKEVAEKKENRGGSETNEKRRGEKQETGEQ